jgi:glycosyltransferase involved in cell wall biosynthesis
LPWGKWSERPRVCIVRQNDAYDESVQREANALADAGFEVEVLCMRSRSGQGGTHGRVGVTITCLPASLHRESLVSYCVDYAWFWTLAASTLAVRHIRRPYSVVQVNTMPDFLVFSAIVPKLLGAQVVAFLKEPTPELFETLYGRPRLSRALERVEQAAIRFADHALTVTEELRQVYIERGAKSDDISVIRTGNAPPPVAENGDRPEHHATTDGFLVLCHGTIEERYGLDTIVDAVQLLRGDIPGLEVVFTGRGGGIDALLQQIDELGLSEIVRFEGWVSRERLDELLAKADVGIVAQKASSYSHLVTTNKMIDYWIFGLPTIASRLRSVSAAHDDSRLEYFEPGDAASLAAAIRRLHDDPARREELARNGRAALEHSGWGAQAELYLEVYDSLVRGYDPVPST